WVSDLEKRFDPSGEQRGMSTGIPSLDRLLAPKGLVKGSLFVIGARPKMGKTTLYGQMAINCAVRERKPALLFSLEMPGDQILEKLVGQKSGVNPNIFYLPATSAPVQGYQGDYDSDFNRAVGTATHLSEIDMLYIDDTPGLSLAHIVSESR
ncbi:helicase DnaB, partial [Salmonella enterica]|nr:helicase DnaB [Salmonella enterica]